MRIFELGEIIINNNTREGTIDVLTKCKSSEGATRCRGFPKVESREVISPVKSSKVFPHDG